MKKPNEKRQEHKLRHEHKKRRKEGEEKAHGDGGMVGWSRHLEDGDSKMSVQAATWGNHWTLKIRLVRKAQSSLMLSQKLSIVSLIKIQIWIVQAKHLYL